MFEGICILYYFFLLTAPVYSSELATYDTLLFKSGNAHPDTTIFYASLAIKLSQAENQKLEPLLLLGKSYNSKSEYSEAMRHLRAGLKQAIDLKDIKSEGLFLIELGKSKQLSQQYKEALKLFFKGLVLFEKLEDHENQLRTHVYLAEYYRNLARFKDAEKHIYKAISISKRYDIKDIQLMIILKNRAAAIKSEMSDEDSSLFFSKEALALSRQTGNRHSEAVSLNEIGFHCEKKGDLVKAIEFYQEARKIWLDGGYKIYWANATGNLARVFHKNGELEKSIELRLLLLPEAEKNQWTSLMNTSYAALADYYYENKNYKLSADYRSKQNETEKELNDLQHQREIDEIKLRFEDVKDKVLFKQQDLELKNANLKLDQQRKGTTFLIYGAGLLLLFLTVLLVIYIQKVGVNKELNIKKELLETTVLDLNKVLAENDLLFKEIHHRIKNNLSVLSGLLRLQEDHSKSKVASEILKKSRDRIQAMAMIHENFYRKEGFSEIEFGEYIHKLMFNLKNSFGVNDNNLAIKMDCQKIILNIQTAVPLALVLNELITNSFKYALTHPEKPLVGVKFFESDSDCVVEVYDNGPGLASGLDIKNATTLGLKLVTMLTEQIDARLDYNKNGLSTFSIRFRK